MDRMTSCAPLRPMAVARVAPGGADGDGGNLCSMWREMCDDDDVVLIIIDDQVAVTGVGGA